MVDSKWKRNRMLLFLVIIFVNCRVGIAQPYQLVVAKDGSGDFLTVQQAINAVPDFGHDTTTIFIKNGVYKEKIIVPASKRYLKLIGENVDSVFLTFGNYASKKNIFGKEMGTSGSSSFYLFASDFTAVNITFQNSAGPVGQAVAMWVAGDKVRFFHCRFLGFQDTLYTFGGGHGNPWQGREYFRNCYIEGTTDFIFGSAIAVFDRCTIFCKKGGHYITAASTPKGAKYGYVFLNCNIIGSAPEHSFYLGRPWRPYAKVVYIHCKLGKMIKPEGWSNWHDTDNDKTAYYAEYKNGGLGAATKHRVSWSYQLTNDQAENYNLKNIFRDWQP